MYVLYASPGTASLAPHMLLRELGVPFELRAVDREAGAQKRADYLALNPNGRIPTLVDGDLVLWESVAILMHLSDRHPEAGLTPPLGSPLRATWYKWLVHLAATPMAEFRTFFYPHEHRPEGAEEAGVAAVAARRLRAQWETIAGQLGEGPWLLGETYSAADILMFMLVRWGRNLDPPLRDIPALAAHAERMLARPAVRATLEAEALTQPYV